MYPRTNWNINFIPSVVYSLWSNFRLATDLQCYKCYMCRYIFANIQTAKYRQGVEEWWCCPLRQISEIQFPTFSINICKIGSGYQMLLYLLIFSTKNIGAEYKLIKITWIITRQGLARPYQPTCPCLMENCQFDYFVQNTSEMIFVPNKVIDN